MSTTSHPNASPRCSDTEVSLPDFGTEAGGILSWTALASLTRQWPRDCSEEPAAIGMDATQNKRGYRAPMCVVGCRDTANSIPTSDASEAILVSCTHLELVKRRSA